MNPETLRVVLLVLALLIGVILHEFGHAWMANRCGDDTAYLSGRLTLNPLAHIDPIGTILLPLLMILSGSGFLFGWAKPVPINPLRFQNCRLDMVKVSFAGPGTNLLLAGACSVLLWATLGLPGGGLLRDFLYQGVVINAVVAVFNLVPIPPLDGSRILWAVLPPGQARIYEGLERFGFLAVLLFFYLGLFGVVHRFVTRPLISFLLSWW